MLTDTHCHLDAEQFAGDPPAALLARAAAAGVTRVVTIGTNLATSRAAVELAEAHAKPISATQATPTDAADVWSTVGVDPNDVADFDARALDDVAALAGSGRVVAIGEIGLDYHWNRAPHDVQKQAFQSQLDLARELGLPVVIHSRDAHADMADQLTQWAASWHADARLAGRHPGVMHCFSGDLALARRLVDLGFLISLGGVVTYKNAAETREVATGLPLEALVLETDAPYLAPTPHRGSRNEPAYLRDIASFVAELRQTTVEALAEATSANAARLFGWGVDA